MSDFNHDNQFLFDSELMHVIACSNSHM